MLIITLYSLLKKKSEVLQVDENDALRGPIFKIISIYEDNIELRIQVI